MHTSDLEIKRDKLYSKNILSHTHEMHITVFEVINFLYSAFIHGIYVFTHQHAHTCI